MSYIENDRDLIEYRYRLIEDSIDEEKIEKEALKKLEEKYKKIKNDNRTDIITYKNNKKVYEYIDELFPKCNIKNVIIYMVSPKVLEKIDIPAYGFYDIKNKYIVVAKYVGKNYNKIFIDNNWDVSITMVHEMLHYCYYDIGLRADSLHTREEFAYGYSVGYIKELGYSEDKIINLSYFMGYYLHRNISAAIKEICPSLQNNQSSINTKKAYQIYIKKEKRILHKAKELARIEIKKMIKKYNNKLQSGDIPCKIIDDNKNYNKISLDL